MQEHIVTQPKYQMTAKEVVLDRIQLRSVAGLAGRRNLDIAFTGVCVFEDSDGLETLVQISKQATMGELPKEIQDFVNGLHDALLKIMSDGYGV